MLNPKRYKAKTAQGYEVEGYYVKHIYATPNPINTEAGYKEFVDSHTKHYIITDGFSDWNLPREMEPHEIDINTLQEI